MSVLIKGMKMPSECGLCTFCRLYPGSGNIWCNAKHIILNKWNGPNWKGPNRIYPDAKRPGWCPLVEVPEKHGRLVDADELEELYRELILEHMDRASAMVVDMIEDASTVIEAEGE